MCFFNSSETKIEKISNQREAIESEALESFREEEVEEDGEEEGEEFERLILIIMAPPGGGKGTHANRIVSEYEIPQLSTGDMLREAIREESEIGLEAKHYMEKGQLVPNEVVNQIIKERINKKDCNKGFILDGYPRNVEQAECLDEMLEENGHEKVSKLLYLQVPDEVLEERICGRWIHKESGRSYHLTFNPPEITEPIPLDDETCEPLEQRPDDTPEVLITRLKTYHSQTAPVVQYYQNITIHINGHQPIENVWKEIQNSLQ